MRLPSFTSVLAPALRSFAEHRQALGYGDHTLRSHLAHFDRYLVARGWTYPYLTREAVEEWVASDGALQPRSRAGRLQAMRLLGRFIAHTHPETYVPGPAWGGSQNSGFRPYIYTESGNRGTSGRGTSPNSSRFLATAYLCDAVWAAVLYWPSHLRGARVAPCGCRSRYQPAAGPGVEVSQIATPSSELWGQQCPAALPGGA